MMGIQMGQLDKDHWVWGAFCAIFLVLLLADRSKSIAHSQFKVLSLIHACCVTICWCFEKVGCNINDYIPLRVSNSWRSEAVLLWTSGYLLEWMFSLESIFAVSKKLGYKPKAKQNKRMIEVSEDSDADSSAEESKPAWDANAFACLKGGRKTSLASLATTANAKRNSIFSCQSSRRSTLLDEDIWTREESPRVVNTKCTLLLAYIPRSASEAEVIEVFSTFGKVSSFKLMRDRNTGVSRCFGFLKFEDPAAAEQAYMTALQGKIVMVEDEGRGHAWHVKADWAEQESRMNPYVKANIGAKEEEVEPKQVAPLSTKNLKEHTKRSRQMDAAPLASRLMEPPSSFKEPIRKTYMAKRVDPEMLFGSNQ